MFDIGFSELVVIGGVALVVLGPERLPKVARTAGHLFGRLQRYVANVKADIQREMDSADLAKMKAEFQDAAQSIQSTVQTHARDIEDQARRIEQDSAFAAIDAPASPPAATARHEETSAPSAIAPAVASSPASSVPAATTDDDASAQHAPAAAQAATDMRQSFDFGIEPVRRIAP